MQAARPAGRSALVLVGSQVRYQLRLVARTPMSTFTIAVVPLLLLVTLNAVMPADALAKLAGREHYVDFLTPAMATFALANAAYINVITSIVLARDSGVLKRLRATPLPAWAHVSGRLLATLVTALLSSGAVVLVGVLFLGARCDAGCLGYGLLLAVLATGCLSALGMAVSVLVPKPESALPVAYGTLLPLGFVSDVFFPATTAPRWLHDLASWFPLAPIARAAETLFGSGGSGWPLSGAGLAAILGWATVSTAVAVAAFRWEPGPLRLRPNTGA